MDAKSFHPNPQVRGMRERNMAKPEPGKTEGTEQPSEHTHVEVHKEGGRIHTIHHPSGERKEHETKEDMHNAVDEHIGEGQNTMMQDEPSEEY